MIKIVVATRTIVPGLGWVIDPLISQKCWKIRSDGYTISEEYVNSAMNQLYVVFDDDAAAALFKLTYL